MLTTLAIDIWSDIACPWCYVGKRRLESALQRFAHRDAVHVTWRAFELNPAAPPVESARVSYVDRLASKYRTTRSDAQTMIDRMTAVAARDALDFHFDRIQPGNTFNAHRLLHLAAEHHLQDAVKERFLRGYLTEGEPIGDPAALSRLAVEAGLPSNEVADVLETDRFAEHVRQEQLEARDLGITGVPFFVFGRRLAVSGAQPAELLLTALDKAWSELDPSSSDAYVEGSVCGPDGCG